MGNQSQTGDLIGRIFDRRYRVNELIGSGGMGSVYRATHLEMNREVALKVLERGVADSDKQVQRFYQEARASSRLQHPNTIRVFDFGRADDGRLYLAMEYLKGETLTDLLRREHIPPPERICKILRQICKSLAEAHQVGIIHRDLKPDNIFITDIHGETDFVKVLDFGIAKSTEGEEQESLTQTGFICGTPRYLSPEQAMGKAIDARSDLYSLGIMLFEMLAGHPPFTAATPIALVMKHIHEQPPRPPDGGSEQARWLGRMSFVLMQKSPARRPPSSAAVAAALDSILAGRPPEGFGISPIAGPDPRAIGRQVAASALPRASAARSRRTASARPSVAPNPETQLLDSNSALARPAADAPPERTVMMDSAELLGAALSLEDDSQMLILEQSPPAQEAADTEDEATRLSVAAMPDDDGYEPTRLSIQAIPEPVPPRPRSGLRRKTNPRAAVVVDLPSDRRSRTGRPRSVSVAPSLGPRPPSKASARVSSGPGRGKSPPARARSTPPAPPREAAPRPSTPPGRSKGLVRHTRGAPVEASPMTRVMQSPLAASEAELPVGRVRGAPAWTGILIAVMLGAMVVGGVAVWWLVFRSPPAASVDSPEAQTTPSTPLRPERAAPESLLGDSQTVSDRRAAVVPKVGADKGGGGNGAPAAGAGDTGSPGNQRPSAAAVGEPAPGVVPSPEPAGVAPPGKLVEPAGSAVKEIASEPPARRDASSTKPASPEAAPEPSAEGSATVELTGPPAPPVAKTVAPDPKEPLPTTAIGVDPTAGVAAKIPKSPTSGHSGATLPAKIPTSGHSGATLPAKNPKASSGKPKKARAAGKRAGKRRGRKPKPRTRKPKGKPSFGVF